MAYSRPPVQPGRALKRTPILPIESTAGVLDYALDADIATTTSLGVVQVGNGLAINPAGILSVTDIGGIYNVKLTSVIYTTTATDYFIGTTSNSADITLSPGVLGKVYVVKNQVNGNIKVFPTNPNTIDGAAFKTLGTNATLTVIFDGTQWSLI